MVIFLVLSPSSAPLAPPAVGGAVGAQSDATHGGRCRERTPGGEWTCEQQAGWGKCDVIQYPWMRGYCCETCHQCDPTCTSVYNFHRFDETAPPRLLLAYDFNEGGGVSLLDASGVSNPQLILTILTPPS